MGKTMINKIKYFLKLRKQNDTVKIIVIFALAGIVSAVSVLYHGWMIYHYVNTPVEYVLTADRTVSTEQVNTLLQLEGVSRVSRQWDMPIMLRYQGAETEVSAVLLSQEYVEEMYDVTLPSGVGRIIMNKVAFSHLQTEWSENREGMAEVESQRQEDGSMVLDVRYRIAETVLDDTAGDDAMEQADQPIRIIVTEKLWQREEPFVCLVNADSRLLREACSLRAQYENHDLDGLHVERLAKLGYAIENEEMILREKNEIQIKLLHIKYGLLLCGICLVMVFSLGRSKVYI